MMNNANRKMDAELFKKLLSESQVVDPSEMLNESGNADFYEIVPKEFLAKVTDLQNRTNRLIHELLRSGFLNNVSKLSYTDRIIAYWVLNGLCDADTIFCLGKAVTIDLEGHRELVAEEMQKAYDETDGEVTLKDSAVSGFLGLLHKLEEQGYISVSVFE